MYKSVIEIKEDIAPSMLDKLAMIADQAFHNRAGRVKNKSNSPYLFSYEGEASQFGCLQLGMLALEKDKAFLACVRAWNWIDEDEPGENEDILAEMCRPIR